MDTFYYPCKHVNSELLMSLFYITKKNKKINCSLQDGGYMVLFEGFIGHCKKLNSKVKNWFRPIQSNKALQFDDKVPSKIEYLRIKGKKFEWNWHALLGSVSLLSPAKVLEVFVLHCIVFSRHWQVLLFLRLQCTNNY